MSVCLGLTLYLGLVEGESRVYTHTYYLPIILVALWYARYTVHVGSILAAVYLTSMYFSPIGVAIEDLARAVALVVIAGFIGFTSTMRWKRTVELTRANEKLSLLGGLTRHDLINQLSVLTGWLEIAKESGDPAEIAAPIDKACESARVIRWNLEFTGQYEEIGLRSPEWVSAKRAWVTGKSGLERPDIVMTERLGGLEIYADAMLDKVFRNLIDNSVRHGGGVKRIGVSYAETKAGLRIVYEDDGVGISDEARPRLFEHASGKQKGYGLHMAAKVLEITGMSIKEVGAGFKGARFEIFVPKGGYRLKVSVADGARD
jgi:signal transduction histidine kinase